MEFVTEHMLSILTFSPLALGILLLCIPAPLQTTQKWFAFGGSLLIFLLSLLMYSQFDASLPGYQFQIQREWLPLLGIKYSLGIDGISLYLVLLTTFLIPIIVLSAWHAVEKDIKK